MMRVLRSGIEISDADLKCLQHDLLNVEDWIQGAITGKIARSKGRLLDQWFPVLVADPRIPTIPADEAEIIKLITNRADYKNRVERDAVETVYLA
jgi:hypothetical protein